MPLPTGCSLRDTVQQVEMRKNSVWILLQIVQNPHWYDTKTLFLQFFPSLSHLHLNASHLITVTNPQVQMCLRSSAMGTAHVSKTLVCPFQCRSKRRCVGEATQDRGGREVLYATQQKQSLDLITTGLKKAKRNQRRGTCTVETE